MHGTQFVSGSFSSPLSPALRQIRHVVHPGSAVPRVDVSSRFGLRLRQLRRDHNMTQLRMAVEFGIDRTYISDVERGRKAISLPMLEVLALGFQLSLSELLRGI